MTEETFRHEGPHEHPQTVPAGLSQYLPVAEHVWAPGQDSVVQVRLAGEVVAEVNWTQIWRRVFAHFGVELMQPSPDPVPGAKLRVVPTTP